MKSAAEDRMNPPPAICRAQGVHELPKKHSPDKRPLFPKTGARSTTDSIEARRYGRLCDRGKERRRSLIKREANRTITG